MAQYDAPLVPATFKIGTGQLLVEFLPASQLPRKDFKVFHFVTHVGKMFGCKRLGYRLTAHQYTAQ